VANVLEWLALREVRVSTLKLPPYSSTVRSSVYNKVFRMTGQHVLELYLYDVDKVSVCVNGI
jgi:hypothetical protein